MDWKLLLAPSMGSVEKVRSTPIKEKCKWKDGAVNVNKNIDLCSLPRCRKALPGRYRVTDEAFLLMFSLLLKELMFLFLFDTAHL